MITMTPTQVIQNLRWIDEVQRHINDCASETHDLECLLMASVLQIRVDREWDRLGVLVRNCPRPFSALRSSSSVPMNDLVVDSCPLPNTNSPSAKTGPCDQPCRTAVISHAGLQGWSASLDRQPGPML